MTRIYIAGVVSDKILNAHPIARRIPQPHQVALNFFSRGPVYLDKEPAGDLSNVQAVTDEINSVRAGRPWLKVGAYGWPMMPYYFDDNLDKPYANAWRGWPVIKASKYIMPSLSTDQSWDYFPTSRARNVVFIHETMIRCLEMGRAFDKPIWPFVWTRFSDHGGPGGARTDAFPNVDDDHPRAYQSIPDEQWEDEIRQIVQHGIKTLVVWFSCQYHYNVYRVMPAGFTPVTYERLERAFRGSDGDFDAEHNNKLAIIERVFGAQT